MNKTPANPFHLASAPDYLPLTQLRDLQLQRLRDIVRRAYANVPLFRTRMQERKTTPDDMKSLADIVRLPFTVKTDLRDTYPFGLFASPMEEIVRLHASSGTTGKPIVVAYNQQDLDVWAGVMVRSFASCGLHRGDIIQRGKGVISLFRGEKGSYSKERHGDGVSTRLINAQPQYPGIACRRFLPCFPSLPPTPLVALPE